MKTPREFTQEFALAAAAIAWDTTEEEAGMELVLKIVDARDAEWQARLDAAVAAERERLVLLVHDMADARKDAEASALKGGDIEEAVRHGRAARTLFAAAAEMAVTPTPEVSRGD